MINMKNVLQLMTKILVIKQGRGIVHGARHILMLITLYRYIISVNQIRQKMLENQLYLQHQFIW